MIAEAHLQSACCDLAADIARQRGKIQLKVAGASMVPALWPGDLVTLRHCDPTELQPNWIVVFRQNERLVTHRLVRRVGGRLVTRGDACPYYDDPLDAREVLGRVEGILRDGRPVSLKFSVWKRWIAAILRHSEWCTGVYLRLGSRIRRFRASATAAGL